MADNRVVFQSSVRRQNDEIFMCIGPRESGKILFHCDWMARRLHTRGESE